MLAMSLLLAVSNPRPSRPRWRSAGRRRSTTHPLAGRSAAEDGGGGTFLPREEWANRGPHGACPVGWKAQGKKVSPALLRLRRSRRSRPSARSSQGEAVWFACRTASSGEDVAGVDGPAQEVRLSRRRERSAGVQKGRRHDRIDPDQRWRYPQDMVLSDWGPGPTYPSAARGASCPIKRTVQSSRRYPTDRR